METFERITRDPAVMGGRACIRGIRFTVSNLLDLLASGRSEQEILEAYPFLEPEDIPAALRYSSWAVSDREIDLSKHAEGA